MKFYKLPQVMSKKKSKEKVEAGTFFKTRKE